jgi:hypothetical protein
MPDTGCDPHQVENALVVIGQADGEHAARNLWITRVRLEALWKLIGKLVKTFAPDELNDRRAVVVWLLMTLHKIYGIFLRRVWYPNPIWHLAFLGLEVVPLVRTAFPLR